MTNRIFNFSAGPATMPESVLQEAQRDLLNFNSSGMSIMEMSHRSKVFDNILNQTKSNIIKLLQIPDSHDVLFLQGGASLQFSMVPMNLKQAIKKAYLINSGVWTKKALKEIKKETPCDVIATTQDQNFLELPTITDEISNLSGSFLFMCSNNTIFGTQFKQFPDTNQIPLVADMSSDILSRPLDISKFGLIFAGAQKNIGPAGVTVVIIKKDLLSRSESTLPSMLNYNSFSDSNSLYNTIPTFGIYMISLTTKYLLDLGGLAVINEKNTEKANRLYNAIDESDFYYCPIKNEDRSLMNVVFRINGSEELETLFHKEAESLGLSGLKGHRSVGGLRASIYNAFPAEGIDALISFMQKFEQVHCKEKHVLA